MIRWLYLLSQRACWQDHSRVPTSLRAPLGGMRKIVSLLRFQMQCVWWRYNGIYNFVHKIGHAGVVVKNF